MIEAHIWAWQLVVKMATKVVCQTLKTGQRYRFLAKEEIEALQLHISDVYNTHCCMEIWLIR